MSEELNRKVISALISYLLFPGIFGLISVIVSGFTSELLLVFIFFFFMLIGNFFYTISVSILSDSLTKNFTKYRFIASAFLHIFFAFLTVFVIKGLSVYAIACSIIFFLLEEWQRRKEVRITRKQAIVNGLSLVTFALLSVYFSYLLYDIPEKETHEYYLIPKGYEGEITVVHNIEHEPEAKKVGDYKVININELGYGITSLPPSEGIIENKYDYFDNEGNKQKIPDNCIHVGGSGSISNGEYEFSYSSITVTDTGCGEAFSSYGSQYLEDHSLDIEEILRMEGLVDEDW